METSQRPAVLYTDGAARGNPGPAGAGFVLYAPGGKALANGSIPLGHATNNVAEYRALIAGLHEASARGIKHLHARTDSELICRQLNGQYRVKSDSIRQFYEWARRLMQRFESIEIQHVPRDQNAEADRLASDAAGRAEEDGHERES